MDLISILKKATSLNSSDIYIIAGRPICCKINDKLVDLDDTFLTPEITENLVFEMYGLTSGIRNTEMLIINGDDDFPFSLSGVARFRVNAFRQRGSYAAVIRIVSFDLPDPSKLGIPDQVMNLSDTKSGLILCTGPSGSGKSTTLACLLDKINCTRQAHIITLEDPVEFLHSHKKSIITQREINEDTESYVVALRAALRQSPDIIFIGELRDAETIKIAMTAAETGHLVFSTLHTLGVVNSIDRIIDVFEPVQQPQIRLQLSMVLQSVVSQQLIPGVDGNLMLAAEILTCSSAVRNMIRESKVFQIDSQIFSSASAGMMSMDASIFELFEKGKISARTAIDYSLSPNLMTKKIEHKNRT